MHRAVEINGINLQFVRPQEHGIVVYDREEEIHPLMQEFGEFTFKPQDDIEINRPISVINLAHRRRNIEFGHIYENTWKIIQAVCLGYSRMEKRNDPACNIYSASAAAGLQGVPMEAARDWINSLGLTTIGRVSGVDDLPYRFLDGVYWQYRQYASQDN
ncbi:hypothetical protein JW796_04765 [Candidatus Dojkabacteria bacterium]|nr:hypothetical protein [Candidatus Dojkabacteria bacterium]